MESPTPERMLRLFRRPAVVSLAALLIYVALSFLCDPGGTLGTDTGAKVATLDHMVDTGSWRPTVGYWAEDWDRTGTYHPLFDTLRNDDGEWINVTTLPMLLLARPLYAVGGYRLALVLPMLGAVGAALAARDIGRRLADDRAGERAFWVVALASPLVVYALDFWEHAIGAGLMLWAVAALCRVVDRRPAWAMVAGMALGLSAAMRTETFVVTPVAVGAACLVLLARRRVVAAVSTGLWSVFGFAVLWFANTLLETALGGNPRSARVAGAAGRSLRDELPDRAREAMITWFGLPGLGYPDGVIVGAVIAAMVIGAVVLHRRGRVGPGQVLAVTAAVLLAVVLLAAGPAFVSGALMASPVALAAFWVADTRPSKVLIGGALIATVGVWAYQFLGGAGPQWGGRYLLGPTLVLTVVGAVEIGRSPVVVARIVLGMAVFVGGFGVVWLSACSHEVDDFFGMLADRPESVVISSNGFLIREAGAAADDHLYLSLSRDAPLEGAVDVVRAAGLGSYAVLTEDADLPVLPGREQRVDEVEFLGVTMYLHSYVLPG